MSEEKENKLKSKTFQVEDVKLVKDNGEDKYSGAPNDCFL